MKTLLLELNQQGAQENLLQLQQALEHHHQWLNRLHETLACRLPPHPSDIADDAHRQCLFGQWYHSVDHPALRDNLTFAAIGEIHQRLHQSARQLLLQAGSSEPISRKHYADFLQEVGLFRKIIFGQPFHLPLPPQEESLISKVADKFFEHSAEGVLITDADSTILNVNESFSRVTGYSRDEVVGQKTNLLKSGRQSQQFYHQMWQSLRDNGHWEGEIWNRRKNGDVFLEWLSISAIRDDRNAVSHYVAMFTDITAERENERQLKHLAYYDGLTDLPNRMLFLDRLRQSVVQAERGRHKMALLFIDLDRFKMVNDLFGHKAGDDLLVEASARLRDCVRASDTVARLSGDEFTIILPEVPDPQSAAQVAQKIIDRLAIPYHVDGQEVFITSSIGIALYPNSARSAEGLTKSADIAMYHAKSLGRNNYQFYRAAVNEGTAELFTLENSLRRALEREELEIDYQPQVDIETGRVSGMEALLRWRHPEKGLIMPSDFIPVAEETGLIVPIGEWVLRHACAQNVAWQKSGFPPMRMAVNISARQLRLHTLAEKVAEVLDETGLDADWLELELTETMMMRSTEDIIGILRQLKSIGVFLSIDDFGTGYSSLSYLKRFPVDTIKIDRSFIQGVDSDFDDAAISQAIIALAHSLRLKVIAEGVETEKQLLFLREHQCCDAQGYYFSRPMSARAITELLQNGLGKY